MRTFCIHKVRKSRKVAGFYSVSLCFGMALFDLVLIVKANIFQPCRDVTCVQPILSRGYSFLLKDTAQCLR